MIYLLMAAVLGFAAWQLVSIVRRTNKGACASGCTGCSSNGHCSIQGSDLIQIDAK